VGRSLAWVVPYRNPLRDPLRAAVGVHSSYLCVSFFEFSFEVRRNLMRQKPNWIAVLLVVLACGAVAQAATIPISTPYTTIVSGAVSSGTAWAQAPTFWEGDKYWTWQSNDAPLDPLAVEFVGNGINHSMTISDPNDVLAPGSYNLAYQVAVAPNGGDNVFQDASLGFTLTGQGAQAIVTKTLTDVNSPFTVLTLSSSDGSTVSTTGVLGWTAINVSENIDLVSGNIYGVTNTFVQTPEPSTLALLGASAIGLLGYVWRRRRRAA
jgi:hypothetical protein